jgi:hypothetical protein
MARTGDFRPTPGFQGSETSGAEVTLYTQGGDPILLVPGDRTIEVSGRKATDEAPSLVGVQTNKVLGPAAGNFVISALAGSAEDLFDAIIDDDWVDIVLTRHGRRWHVMRGLVDEVRRQKVVTGTGATLVAYTIAGRDFGKIWEVTPVWFSMFLKENLSGHVAQKAFTGTFVDFLASNVIGDEATHLSPAAAVRGYLFGFLEELEGMGRANWNPPPSMPNITDGSFIKSLYLNLAGFSNLPERKAIDPNFAMASGTLWDLAKEWSDPLFTELYVDLLASGSQVLQGVEVPVDETIMTVVYRDRPFPVVAEEWEGDKGEGSAWFSLPLFIIPREAIVTDDVGRSGLERYNAFFVASVLHQEDIGQAALELIPPLWERDEILRHGLRRFDIQSKYAAPDASLINITKAQRAIVRDWYCLNPYFFNGTLDLAIGMPDIRVGVRARVPGTGSEDQDETYYVEGVRHNWRFGQGLKTSLDVTRGWRGTDASLVEALEKLAGRYEVVEPAE